MRSPVVAVEPAAHQPEQQRREARGSRRGRRPTAHRNAAASAVAASSLGQQRVAVGAQRHDGHQRQEHRGGEGARRRRPGHDRADGRASSATASTTPRRDARFARPRSRLRPGRVRPSVRAHLCPDPATPTGADAGPPSRVRTDRTGGAVRAARRLPWSAPSPRIRRHGRVAEGPTDEHRPHVRKTNEAPGRHTVAPEPDQVVGGRGGHPRRRSAP